MYQKHLRNVPSWLIGGLVSLVIDVLYTLRGMFLGWERVIAPFWLKISYFIGVDSFFRIFVVFLSGCLVGKIFSKEWKTMPYSKRGMILGSIFGFGGFIFIRPFIEQFSETFVVILFLPLVMAFFGLVMRGQPAGALEVLMTLTIATGITVAFYALVGAGIGKIISNIKK